VSRHLASDALTADFIERVRVNQQKLTAELKAHYDFIVCGSGSSGAVVARRLAENPSVSVLLEAGGSDDVPSVADASQWALNLGSERDWGFYAQPNPHLNGRAIPMNMGKVLGGGSSINVMTWARGHQSDWDFFASEVGDPAWSYASVLQMYRRIEDWHGTPDPTYRGTGGPVFVQPAPDPHPIAFAMFAGARSVGIPRFEHQNGRLMEGEGGASLTAVRACDGKRPSVFRSSVFPYMDRPHLTVLTHALVTRVTCEGERATGVEMSYTGSTHRLGARLAVGLSLGAMHTPKVLMQSGIGDQAELQRFGIPIVQHLPGVGQNLQDHPGLSCVWESLEALPPHWTSQTTCFWQSASAMERPDLQTFQPPFPVASAEHAARFGLPARGWSLFGAVVRPQSRGRIRLTGSHPLAPVRIDANLLSHPDDLKAARASVDLCREIGNAAALRPFAKREVRPGNVPGAALEHFLRNAAVTYGHQSCTAKLGRDRMSVVDGHLRV
jgi:choline dehydrogenase